MHLQSIYHLLRAAADQPKIVDSSAEIVVREMVDLGLVDATLSDGRKTEITAINRLTEAGQRFLRVVEGEECALLHVYRTRKQEANRVLAAGRFGGGELVRGDIFPAT